MAKKSIAEEKLRVILSELLGMEVSDDRARRLYNWSSFSDLPVEKISDPSFWHGFYCAYPVLLREFCQEVADG